jgi:ribonuclease Z
MRSGGSWMNGGLLFDCGDSAAAGLLPKGRKVKTVAVTHADRDHLSGLLQFL